MPFIVFFLLLLVFVVVAIRWTNEWTQDELGFVIQAILPDAHVHVPGFIAFILNVITGGSMFVFVWCFRCIVGM